MVTVANLKQEVITTLHQEIAQIIQTDIQNIQADITNIQQTISSNNKQSKMDMHAFHQQLTASGEHFQKQMMDLTNNFQQQLQAQQDQMTAFLQQMANQNNSRQLPPQHQGGGAY